MGDRSVIMSRVGWYAAVATALVWTFKALAIWQAGGLNKTSLEDLGWVVGTLLFLVAWVAIGATFAAGRAVWVQALAGVGGAFLGFVLFLVLDGAADVLPSSTGWVHEEAGLWAVAFVTLAVAWRQRRRVAPSPSPALATG